MKEYHFQKLNACGQKCYQRILKAIERTELSVFLGPGTRTEDISTAIQAIEYDHPELYYTDFRYLSCNSAPWSTALNLRYYPNRSATLNRVEEKLHSLLTAPSYIALTTSLAKYRYLHDFLVRTVKYQSNATSQPEHFPEAYSVTGPLLNGYGVCEGIAKAYKLLCDRAGLDCLLVTGRSRLENLAAEEDHAWNIIFPDAQPTHVDVTWDICGSIPCGCVRYDYFGLSDAHMQLDHQYVDYPACTTDEYSYFYRMKCSFQTSTELQHFLEREAPKKLIFLYFRADTSRAAGERLAKAIQKQVTDTVSRYSSVPCQISMFSNTTQKCFLFKFQRQGG